MMSLASVWRRWDFKISVRVIIAATAACFAWFAGGASAQAQSAAELAQKAQDPLADITALMTDNTIGFNQGLGGDTDYNFQRQPVKSFDTPYGFRLIPRAIIPIVGAPVDSNFAFLGIPLSEVMGTIGFLALVANLTSVLLLL